MQLTVLEYPDVEFDREALLKRLHLEAGSPQALELDQLLAAAKKVAKPKAAFGLGYIRERGDDFVVLDDVRFDSRVLAVNLAKVDRAFPYLATCGAELEEWAAGIDDVLYRFWSEAIREAAMRSAMAGMAGEIDRTYAPGQTSRMSPGSLTDWPIQQQQPLFRLLGDADKRVGITLTESLLMIPSKSVSGIRFATEANFESCRLCPREAGPGRRAPYDPALFQQQYRRE